MSKKTGHQDEDKQSAEVPPHLSENLSDEVASMWEIPQIYQFLCLAKETLGIQHLSMYEMERMLSMPKASKQLGCIMTSLLCPPMPKSKLRTMPPMPYPFWTNLLTQKALTWFKVYQSKEQDTVKVLETIGVEPEFWKIFPQPELISERKFEKLSLRERVWLLKTVCDTLIHTRRSLQDEVAKNYLDDDNEMVLGKDRHGARYIYFPIFLNNDLRVYRHCLDNKILLSVKQVKKDAKPKPETTSEKRVVRRKRKSWRFGKLPTKSRKRPPRNDKLAEKSGQNEVDQQDKFGLNGEDKKEEKTEADEDEQVDGVKQSKDEKNKVKKMNESGIDDEEKIDGKKSCAVYSETPQVDSKDTVTTIDSNTPREDQDTQLLRDDVSSSSKTDDEKINERKTTASPTVVEHSPENSKSDDEKITQLISSNGSESSGDKNSDNRTTWVEGTTINTENNNVECANNNKTQPVDDNTDTTKSNSEKSASKKEIEEFNRMITDLAESSFRLVADSLDALRDLAACFTAQNYPEGPETVACEVQLIKKINSLIGELEKIETTLKESKSNAREKLQREWTNFQEGVKESEGQPEDGERSSNTWILGSQGCPLLANGDTLSQPGVEGQPTEGGVKVKIEKKDPDEESNGSENENRRVLRARGISSYVEPFSTSSEDSDASQVDGWTGFETIDTNTGAPMPLPELYPQKPRPIGEGSAEDSDQDWILPGSRKRRRKRSSQSKRYKSLQNKLQTINSHSSTTLLPAVDPISTEAKSRINALNNASPVKPVNKIKITSVHSELDIKDEGPIIDNVTSGTSDNTLNSGVQQNYVLVNTGNGLRVNYVVMPQDNPQPQPAPVVSVVPPVSVPQSYYIQSPQGYIVSPPHVTPYRPPPYGGPSNLQPMIIQQGPQMMPQQPFMSQPNNFVQYQQVVPPMAVYPGGLQAPVVGQHPGPVPRAPNRDIQIRAVGPIPLQRPPHPVGAVIRSTVPFRGAARLPAGARPRPPPPRAGFRPARPSVRLPVINNNNNNSNNNNNNNGSNKPSPSKPTTKTTSLIVLSDSDDEIEMIITEKCDTSPKKQPPKAQSVKQKPVITSEVTVPSKSVLSPQIIQRMNQGGISITPIKPKVPEKSTISGGTQLVVVVNETGSHYALALPNGSKLILTPEQVAQIRASNGGKLIL